MRKTFGYKSITHLIYGLLMMLPFFAILIKVLYVQVNKNAYQSYSGNTLMTNNYINDKEKLIYDEIYTFTSGQATSVGMVGGYTDFIQYEIQDVIYNDTNIDLTQFDALGFYCSDNSTIVYYYLNNTLSTFNMNNNFNSNMHVQFTFKYKYNNLPSNSNVLEKTNNFYQVSLDSKGYMDNVFYYSVNEIIKDNNVGLIDFTSWFHGLALSDNAINNTFINFINWYFNYAIIVSAVNILFLCLLWFVNFARKLLERGMNYDW